MSIALLWIGTALCAAVVLAFATHRHRARPVVSQGEPEAWEPLGSGLWPGAVEVLAWAGFLILPMVALDRLHAAMSVEALIAACAAYGVALLLLGQLARRPDEPRSWGDVALGTLFVASLSWGLFDFIHFNGKASEGWHFSPWLVFLAIGLVASWRSLIANWNNEEALTEEFATDTGGYIRRRRMRVLPVRASAILQVVGCTALMGVAILMWLTMPRHATQAEPSPETAQLAKDGQ